MPTTSLREALNSVVDLSELSTTELLNLKRVLGGANMHLVKRLRDRLTELIELKMENDSHVGNIFWEDISYWANTNEIIITGLRTFDIGDTVESDGTSVEITEENHMAVALRIKMMLPEYVFKMLDDPTVTIQQVIDEMESPTQNIPPPKDLEKILGIPTPTTPPGNALSDDPVSKWLYAEHNRSKTKH